jgi:hypothetical protein
MFQHSPLNILNINVLSSTGAHAMFADSHRKEYATPSTRKDKVLEEGYALTAGRREDRDVDLDMRDANRKDLVEKILHRVPVSPHMNMSLVFDQSPHGILPFNSH